MKLDKFQLDLFLAFTARHKRFLKLRETSFNVKQIEDGVKISEKCVKAVQAVCKSLNLNILTCVSQQSSKAKAARALRKKVSRLSPKQANFILDNFEAFQIAVTLNSEPLVSKSSKRASEYGDKYYQPVQHKYR